MPKKNLGDPIPRPEPYIVPATPEKEFDSVWLRNINIFAPETLVSGNAQGNINIECLPYNASGQNIYSTPDNEGVEYINVPNRANGRKSLQQCVSEVPEVKTAMDAITAAIPALRTWVNTPPPPPSGDGPPNN
jgi:hypothetical protein|tara:strand:- start:260 stop:658 length:399 start_codon:yes stop_codon:yes gene_type:complete